MMQRRVGGMTHVAPMSSDPRPRRRTARLRRRRRAACATSREVLHEHVQGSNRAGRDGDRARWRAGCADGRGNADRGQPGAGDVHRLGTGQGLRPQLRRRDAVRHRPRHAHRRGDGAGRAESAAARLQRGDPPGVPGQCHDPRHRDGRRCEGQCRRRDDSCRQRSADARRQLLHRRALRRQLRQRHRVDRQHGDPCGGRNAWPSAGHR